MKYSRWEIFKVKIYFPQLYLQDRDKTQTGKISLDQLVDIFRIYQVKFGERFLNSKLDVSGGGE